MKKDAEHLVRCISNLKSGCPVVTHALGASGGT